MRRLVAAPLLLIFAPAVVLAILAFRVVDHDHAERVAALQADIENEAAGLARRIEASLAEAVDRSRDSGAVGYARAGRWLGDAPEPGTSQLEPSPGELRYYRLAVRGGESWELARRDPERALDAYAFYLPRIRAPELRARLELRMARALLSQRADKKPLNARLGTRLLEGLVERAKGLRTEEGLPLDRVAAMRLGDQDRELTVRRLAAWRALEDSVAVHPQILSERGAVLGDGDVLVAEDADRAGSLRAIRLVPWRPPSLDESRIPARFLPGDGDDGMVSGSPERARAAVRVGGDGAVVGWVETTDPTLGDRVAELEGARNVRRAFVVALLGVTLAGGVALVYFIRRERELARLRARLLRNVSHELRTPVTSIRLFAELLAEDGLGADESRRFAGLLREETRRLGGVFDDFADLARNGKLSDPVAVEPIDLRETLREIADGFRVRAENEGVRFVTGGLDEAASDAVVTTHAGIVERIVRNLLDNALKYGQGQDPEVRLHLALDGRGAAISIGDNGRGVPRAERERIFEELHRVCYDDYSVRGSGLGLAIARRLARSLGGDVTLESEEGRGSTFTLRLPREVVHGERASPGDRG